MRGMREMTRLIIRSRKVLIGIAFVGMMIGSGGFLGSLAGVMLALLARSVLDINTGTGEFIAAWALAGSLVALLFSTFIVLREFGLKIGASEVPAVAAAAAQATESN